MAFPEDDDFEPAPRTRPSARGGGTVPDGGGGGEQSDLFRRRVIALLLALGLIFIVVFGVKACLDNRKTRGYENYASDVGSIVTQSNQLALEFFTRLQTPPEKSDPLNLQAAIAADRGTAEGLLDRVEGLDTPSELSDPQEELVKAFELRRDAFADIAEQIQTALGSEGRNEAIDGIAGDMRVLLAGDVLYARAAAQINEVFAEQEINAEVADSIFVPEPVNRWLDEDEVNLILSAFADSAGVAPGLHGLELVGASIDKTPLIEGSENNFELSSPLSIGVEVTNGGESDEVDVVVSAEISGPTGVLEAEGNIARIEPGQIGEATIQLEQDPPTGSPLTLEVNARGVPGEELLDNNTKTYTISFD